MSDYPVERDVETICNELIIWLAFLFGILSILALVATNSEPPQQPRIVETAAAITLTLETGRVITYKIVPQEALHHCHTPLVHNNHYDDPECDEFE